MVHGARPHPALKSFARDLYHVLPRARSLLEIQGESEVRRRGRVQGYGAGARGQESFVRDVDFVVDGRRSRRSWRWEERVVPGGDVGPRALDEGRVRVALHAAEIAAEWERML